MKKRQVMPTVLAASIVLALTACGKKDAPADASTTPAPADDVPHFKQTGKFGTVSAIDLTPEFQVPAKYASYVHQQASELNPDETRKLDDAVFENYVKTWLTQAASVTKPDWDTVAAITHPAVTEEGDAFKKQAVADQAKKEVTADAKSLDMVFGWQGEVLYVAGPDVTNGEYYLTIRPDHRYNIVSYNKSGRYGYTLYYVPDFKSAGMTGDNRGDMQITVKVPIDRAREIEGLRAGGVPMMRVYGHVAGLHPGHTPILRKDLSEAALEVDVQALEFGVRREGQFKTLFFLDTDQLRKSKA